MLNFKPEGGGDLVESSDDLEGLGGVDMDDSDIDSALSDDDDDTDASLTSLTSGKKQADNKQKKIHSLTGQIQTEAIYQRIQMKMTKKLKDKNSRRVGR